MFYCRKGFELRRPLADIQFRRYTSSNFIFTQPLKLNQMYNTRYNFIIGHYVSFTRVIQNKALQSGSARYSDFEVFYLICMAHAYVCIMVFGYKVLQCY